MTIKKNATWQKRFVETIDQRKLELPPVWVSMPSVANARSERGQAVFESGQSREMANAVVSLLSQAREKAVMSSFLVMATAMLARPLGAIAFGHIGDRFGRKFDHQRHADHQRH